MVKMTRLNLSLGSMARTLALSEIVNQSPAFYKITCVLKREEKEDTESKFDNRDEGVDATGITLGD